MDRLANGKIHETNLFSFKKGETADERLGHGQRPWHFVTEHLAPMNNLSAILLHKIDHSLAGVDRGRGESRLDNAVSEIVVGMSMGDVDSLQIFRCGADHGHETRRIAKNKARVDEDRVL